MSEWRELAEFPDYDISPEGLVRSRNPFNGPEPKILSGTVTPTGYTAFILRKGKKPCRRLLHRLLAVTFIPNPLGLTDVAHEDGNPSHNEIVNLRWSTHRDNQMDMRRHGTMQDGEKCVTCKISENDARNIQIRANRGERQISLAREYGISRSQVSRIVLGQRWAILR